MPNPYLQAKVMTATPGELLLMLYDGALRFCRQAAAHLEHGKPDQARRPLGRTLAIVQELHGMLNPSQAPELCARLESLYLFSEQRLLEALATGEAIPVREVEKVLEQLRQGWVEAVDQVEARPVERRTG